MELDMREELQTRDTVLAIVAHDIRSPLSTIAMTVSLLRDANLGSEERSHFLDMICRATEHIDRLIRDILDITRIESGELRLERAPVRIDQLLAEIVEMHAAQAAAGGIALSLSVTPGDSTAYVDGERLNQVLTNLITNALKFTPRGGSVSINAFTARHGLQIEVSDTGCGIPESELPHIFERFWQAQHARRAGAGLGLAICKGIVEAHGGTIQVDSRAGAGSTFTLSMPLAPW